MEDKNIMFHINGGQVNFAKDNATIYATQNNDVGTGELDRIIKGITDHLSELNKADADEIKDVIDMVKEELDKPEPKAGRLRNCVTLIAPMITIANGIPTLVNNLQKLMDYITPYIR